MNMFVAVIALLASQGVTPRVGSPQASCIPQMNHERPCFTPYDTGPKLRNPDEASKSLSRHYPQDLRAAGIEGQPVIFMLVDSTGRIANAFVDASSGYDVLDSAALKVALDLRFAPALLRGKPVWAWFQVPIRFCVNCGGSASRVPWAELIVVGSSVVGVVVLVMILRSRSVQHPTLA
jgi:TonB family protein